MRVFLLLAVGPIACSQAAPPDRRSPTAPTTAPSTGGSLTFTALPIPLAAIEFIVPLGNLNPPDHTLPTDHVYFYHRLNNRAAPVYEVVAPAGGTVQSISRRNDDQILIRLTAAAMYYLDHVRLDSSISNGATVSAGQRLGTTSDQSFGLDLGLIDSAVTLAFTRPARYGDNTLHAASPLKYFTEPLRTTLYAGVQRAGPDKDGKIDFDVPNTLAGNWFTEDLPVAQSAIVSAGPKQLAFVRYVADPSQLMISVGGTLALSGMFSIAGSLPDPATVTASSGVVSYTLRRTVDGTGTVAGTMLVQMLAADRLRAEIVTGAAAPAGFSSQSVIYVR